MKKQICEISASIWFYYKEMRDMSTVRSHHGPLHTCVIEFVRHPESSIDLNTSEQCWH